MSRTAVDSAQAVKSLAEEMMRASWATGAESAWRPVQERLHEHIERLLEMSIRWASIEDAPKNAAAVLVNDTNPGMPPWVAAHWLQGEEWSGWVYNDEILHDSCLTGPQPTLFLRVPALPESIASKGA